MGRSQNGFFVCKKILALPFRRFSILSVFCLRFSILRVDLEFLWSKEVLFRPIQTFIPNKGIV
ncbi:hypothetical protein [Leptospira biflexa]|uniref:Uncharacterized protein n=1 Tax=Leptospira biflexa serovar Patoc (strain Patoc 1 / ATCC 23582 / Paris) TaxID=456481 RepID=B0SLG3_LEPBP|nr:hypothetical protein [Leptospira biflexa]ABZ98549.1 Hypothetical protein LEPBI_I2460 [Leptospira biflexa serovar Patoc strain 'Patoc 1 (Paris)']